MGSGDTVRRSPRVAASPASLHAKSPSGAVPPALSTAQKTVVPLLVEVGSPAAESLTSPVARSSSYFVCVFLPVYALYLAPLALALYNDEGRGPGAALSQHVLGTRPLPGLLLALWWLVCSLLYAVLRWVLPQEWVGGKIHAKEDHLHKQDLVWLYVMTGFSFFLGRIQERLSSEAIGGGWSGGWFLFLVCVYTGFFSVLFELVRKFEVTLTRSSLRSPYTVAIVVITVIVIVLLVRNQALCALKEGQLTSYVCYLGLILTVHCGLVFGPGAGVVHIHHYWWSWLASFLCVFDSESAAFASAMFLGCSLHGLAAYGAEPIFERFDETKHGKGRRHAS